LLKLSSRQLKEFKKTLESSKTRRSNQLQVNSAEKQKNSAALVKPTPGATEGHWMHRCLGFGLILQCRWNQLRNHYYTGLTDASEASVGVFDIPLLRELVFGIKNQLKHCFN